MTLHLTLKNIWTWLAAMGIAGLTLIGLLVPSEQWHLPVWKWTVLALFVLTALGVTVTLFQQSKEDQDRDKREANRDKAQAELLAAISQITAQSKTSTSLTPSTAQAQTVQSVTPPVDFDAAKYFRTAYHSQWSLDVEKRIRIAAAQNNANLSAEDFYAKFIGTGLVSYMHDMTWWHIWRSQILMLKDLNRRGGIMPITEARKFFDGGKVSAPGFYTSYTFEQWLGFMQSQILIVRHPSEMLEITVRGRDFLSYCAHYSRSEDQKRG